MKKASKSPKATKLSTVKAGSRDRKPGQERKGNQTQESGASEGRK